MSEDWIAEPLRNLLLETFAGEWGNEPDPANCVVFRSTDLDDQGNVVGKGAPRRVPASKLVQKQLNLNDILLEASGGSPDKPVGRTALVETELSGMPSTCSNFFRVMRPNTKKVDPRFLNHKLVWRYRQPEIYFFQQQTTGIINLKVRDFLDAKLSIPYDVDRQTKISEILDTLDAAIRGTEALVGKLRAMKRGLLSDLLTRGIDHNGDLRPPYEEAPHLYHKTPLGWLPLGWEVHLLDNVAQRGSGHTPSKSSPSFWNGGIRWVSLADSHRLDNIFIHETDKEISDAGLANSSAVLHPENTVILSRDAGIGKSAILAFPMAVSQHFMAWRCTTRLNHFFLYYILQREKPMFEAIAMGSTIKTIGLAFFKRFQVALPPRQEQDRSVEILLEAERNIAAQEGELSKLRALKFGLMENLLTGRVSVAALVGA